MFKINQNNLTFSYNSKIIKQKAKKEYEQWKWIVLFGCFLFQMFPYCVALNLSNVFTGSDWIAWTQGNATIIGLSFTIGSMAAAIVGPFIAKIFGKHINMRLVYGLGVTLAMIGFASVSINAMLPENVRSLSVVTVILFVSNAISQIGVMIFSGLGINNLISKWWPHEKRGFALGLAFTGGAVGNIWMQQLVGALSKLFGNTLYIGKGNVLDYGYDAIHGYAQNPLFVNQYVTYLIMASIGLICGIMIVLFACRKPMPSIDIFNVNETNIEFKNKTNNTNKLEASPLNTFKYPIYWILLIGYFLIQMGAIHNSTKGNFVQNALANNYDIDYSQVMAIGGTLFGVACLVGNFSGGILNDKIGPTKSIFFAGLIQGLAVFCLMLSIKSPYLYYLYSIMSGISIYIFTSTPSYICGKLYGSGQSNNHMAILGMFTAVGFAVVNSIWGSLTGELKVSNSHTLFGLTTYGNLFVLEIFSLLCLVIGSIIVSICCSLILKKGIKGLLDYSPTKYSYIIFIKYSFYIFISCLLIDILGFDFRNTNFFANKIKSKKSKNKLIHYFKNVENGIKQYYPNLNDEQIKVLTYIASYKQITKTQLIQYIKCDLQTIDSLLKLNLIDQNICLNIETIYFVHNQDSLDKLLNKYSTIKKEMLRIDSQLKRITLKTNKKISKINGLISKFNNQQIDGNNKPITALLAENKIKKIEAKKTLLFSKVQNSDDWTKYKCEYNYLEKLYYLNRTKNILEIKKEEKLATLNKKLNIAYYISNYNSVKEIEGHDLLINYYLNKVDHYNDLITKKVIHNLTIKNDKLTFKYDKFQSKKDKILSSLI